MPISSPHVTPRHMMSSDSQPGAGGGGNGNTSASTRSGGGNSTRSGGNGNTTTGGGGNNNGNKPQSMVQTISRRNSSYSEIPTDMSELFDILDNPLSSGYLHAFCEMEYNSESIRYVLAIDEFKDMMKRDFGLWKSTYKEVDRMVKMSEKNLPIIWPSNKVLETEARAKANEIFNEFISHNGTSQICLATDVYNRTVNRIRLLHLYGTYTFEESLTDPLRTLKRDILPRFRNSKLFDEMTRRETYLLSDITVNDLHPPEPPAQSIQINTTYKIGHRFDLNELLSFRELYQKFAAFTHKFYCTENLYCYRMIQLFEMHCNYKHKDPTHVQRINDLAWEIFRYFVAEHSIYEVSTYHAHRKRIMLRMASPTASLFDPIKQSVYSSLKTMYHKYTLTEEYQNLVQTIHDEQIAQQSQLNQPKQKTWGSCFLSIPRAIVTGLKDISPIHWTRKRISPPQIHEQQPQPPPSSIPVDEGKEQSSRFPQPPPPPSHDVDNVEEFSYDPETT